jgi:anaerobic magnesium-protoporphyrin IX monomethyl ester cyclase
MEADMKGKRILFITPPYHCGVVEVAGRWIPLTFAYLGGAVREAGFEPVIFDAMTRDSSHGEIERVIEETKPDFVATTAITSTAPDAVEVLRTAKRVNPGIITIIGGVHPTFMYREMLRESCVDYVVRGEGEETLRELLVSINDDRPLTDVRGIAYRMGHKIVATPSRPFIEDIDTLRPAWDLIEWKDYRYFVIPRSRLGAVSTSRGCSHDCTFCSQQKFWHQSWRARRPESVVQEMEHLQSRYGVNVFLITDEYPTSDRARWERLLDLLIERDLGIYILMETRAEDILRDRDILWKYRKAGIVHIYIGVEATDQETLDLIKKDIKVETGREALNLIHEHGMITETSFILGFPHETEESIRRTLELSKHYNPDFAHYLALAPWPYADMYGELEPFVEVRDYRKYNLIDPVIKPEKMSLEEIDRAIIDCYHSFYMGKLKDIINLENDFKKRYILSSMKLIMNSSFIVDKLGTLGRIPAHVESLMKKLDRTPMTEEPGEEGFVSLASRSVVIDAPVERVFSFVAAPENWPRFISGLSDIRPVTTPFMKAGAVFEWSYRIRGIELQGKGEIAGYEKERFISLRMHSLMPIRKNIRFVERDGSTVLTVEVGYHRPGRVLSFLFNSIRKVLNIMETSAVLSRIKALCEEDLGREVGKREIASG